MYVVEAIHDLSPALFSAGSTTSSLSPSLLRLVDGRSMAVSEERDQRPYKLVRSRTCFANERCRRNWRTREGATLPQLASQTRWLSFSLVALSSPLVVCLQPAAGSDMAASELSLLALQISRASKAPPTDLDCLSPRYLHTRPIGRSRLEVFANVGTYGGHTYYMRWQPWINFARPAASLGRERSPWCDRLECIP